MENLVRQLREQQAILTTYLRDQKNHHEDVIAKLEEKQQEIKKQMIAQHEDEKERLKKEQAEYVTLLQRHHKSINAMIENSYVERIKHLKNEYALLQAALRNYKQAVRSDIGKSWDTKVAEIKASSEKVAAKQIRLVRQEMQRQFEIRKADMVYGFECEVDERVKAEVEKELAKLISRGGETEDRLLCAGGAEAMKPDSNTLQNPDIPLQQSTCKTNQASAPDSLMSPITSFGKNVQETSD